MFEETQTNVCNLHVFSKKLKHEGKKLKNIPGFASFNLTNNAISFYINIFIWKNNKKTDSERKVIFKVFFMYMNNSFIGLSLSYIFFL